MSNWIEKLQGPFIGLMILLSLAYGALILYVGYVGIDVEFGRGWAIAVLIATVVFRFTIPIVVGTVLGAMHLWDWHWLPAVLLAMPGILFMIPAIFCCIYQAIKAR